MSAPAAPVKCKTTVAAVANQYGTLPRSLAQRAAHVRTDSSCLHYKVLQWHLLDRAIIRFLLPVPQVFNPVQGGWAILKAMPVGVPKSSRKAGKGKATGHGGELPSSNQKRTLSWCGLSSLGRLGAPTLTAWCGPLQEHCDITALWNCIAEVYR